MAVSIQAAPNPFTERTSLRIAGPAGTPVRVLIVDAAGRRVRAVWEGVLGGGNSTVVWDGRDDSGRAVPAGVYLASVNSVAGRAVGRLLLLR